MTDPTTPGTAPRDRPLVTAVEMGYGHLRAAWSLAEALGEPVARADRAPYAGGGERLVWTVARTLYEGLSRGSQAPVHGRLLRPVLDAVTRIGPPQDSPDAHRPTLAARHLDALVARGLGHGVVDAARIRGRPLLTTFFVPALAAQRIGYRRTFCLITDTDASRAWVPATSRETAITYLAPSRRVVDRLVSYGVPAERIEETGFPLPPELLGGRDLQGLRRHLASRLVRLDPGRSFIGPRRREIEALLGPLPSGARGRPPLLTYAVGGAGAQSGLARRILRELRPALVAGRVRLCLVAGTRQAVAARFREWIAEEALENGTDEGSRMVDVLAETDLEAYFRAFHRRLAETDILWTKPSEMTFFAALGLPLLLAPPVGAQECANGRWVLRAGAALAPRVPQETGDRLIEWIERGTLARAAFAGFRNLRADGLYRILDRVAEGVAPLSSPPLPGPPCRAPSIRPVSSP